MLIRAELPGIDVAALSSWTLTDHQVSKNRQAAVPQNTGHPSAIEHCMPSMEPSAADPCTDETRNAAPTLKPESSDATSSAISSELGRLSFTALRLRWSLRGVECGWQLRIRTGLACDVHDLDDLSLVPVVREQEIQLTVTSAGPQKPSSADLSSLRIAIDAERFEAHIGPAAIQLASSLATHAFECPVQACNCVYNMTPTAILFGQMGTGEEILLAPHSQKTYTWLLPTSELRDQTPKDLHKSDSSGSSLASGCALAGFDASRLLDGNAGIAGMGDVSCLRGGAETETVAVCRMLRFRLHRSEMWSDGIGLGCTQRRWLLLQQGSEQIAVLAVVEASGFRSSLTILPSHMLFNSLPFPIHVEVLRDGDTIQKLDIPAYSQAQPLLLCIQGGYPRVSHNFVLRLLADSSGSISSEFALPLPPPFYLPKGGAGPQLPPGRWKESRFINHFAQSPELGKRHKDDLGPFWCSAHRAGALHSTTISLSAPLYLSNTFGALGVRHHSIYVRGAIEPTQLAALFADHTASSLPVMSAEQTSLTQALHITGMVRAGAVASVCLYPQADYVLCVQLQLEHHEPCEPPAILDQHRLDGISTLTPIIQPVYTTNQRGERIQLMMVVQKGALSAFDVDAKTPQSGQASNLEQDGGDDLAKSFVECSDCVALHVDRTKTQRIPRGVQLDSSDRAPALAITLLAPFEVFNLTELPLAFCSSFDRHKVLVLPPQSSGELPHSILGSWGSQHHKPTPTLGDLERTYFVRLAALEATSHDGVISSPCNSNQDAPKRIRPDDLKWSGFTSVLKPACVTLPFGSDEVVDLVVQAEHRRVGEWVQRSIAIRPAVRVYNLSSLPLKLAVCGFPYFHRLPALMVDDDKIFDTPEDGGLDLSIWQRDVCAEMDELGFPRVVPFSAVQLCVESSVSNVDVAVQASSNGGQHIDPAMVGSDSTSELGKGSLDGLRRNTDCTDATAKRQGKMGGSNSLLRSVAEAVCDDLGKLGGEAAEPPVWLWSRDVIIGSDKAGWRQRVALASECGQLALLTVELHVQDTGVRYLFLRMDSHPPIRIHNLTSHDLYVTDAAASPLDPPYRIAAGVQRPFYCAADAEEPISSAALQKTGTDGTDARALLVSCLSSARPDAASLVLAPARVITLICPSGSASSGRSNGGTLIRAAVSCQGPTRIIVFVPLHLPTALDTPVTVTKSRPPRDLTLSLRLGETSIVVWDSRNARTCLPARYRPVSVHSQSHAAIDEVPCLPLLHLRAIGSIWRIQRAVQPPPLPSSLQGGLQRLPSPHTLSTSISVRSLQVDGWSARSKSAHVILSAERSQLGLAATAARATQPMFRLSLLTARQTATAPRYIQLLEVHCAPLDVAIDDALLARLHAFAVNLSTSANAIESDCHPPNHGPPRPPRVMNSKAGRGVANISQAQGAFVERLEIGSLQLTITANTSQLGPVHVAANRAPLCFAPLTIGALHTSTGMLGRAILSRCAMRFARPIAHGPAIICRR